METLKDKTGGIVICIFELAVGILLFANPVGFTSAIIMMAGIALMVLGLAEIIKYFRTSAREASLGQMLAKGLLAVLTGIFCIFQTEWFIATFPVLTVLYGIVTLVIGVGKVQMAVDMIRMKRKKWTWAAVNAVISLACAFVILKTPFASTAILWLFTGAALTAEGILDLVTLIADGKEHQQRRTSPYEKSE